MITLLECNKKVQQSYHKSSQLKLSLHKLRVNLDGGSHKLSWKENDARVDQIPYVIQRGMNIQQFCAVSVNFS
jgi:threonyl-tRNA synthetase